MTPHPTHSLVNRVFCTQEGRRKVHTGVLIFDVSHTPNPPDLGACKLSPEWLSPHPTPPSPLICIQVVEVHVPSRVDGLRYLAGDDPERAEALTAAFLDPTTSAVVCARGGYGCLRLLPHLDRTKLPGEVRGFGWVKKHMHLIVSRLRRLR